MKSAHNREKNRLKDTNGRLSEMTDTFLTHYEHALQTGLKFQEEAGRWWNSLFNQTSLTQDWQKRVAHAT